MEDDTVDGWNPANQLRLVTYPIIYKVLAPSKRWLFGISEPSTVSRHFSEILIIWQERIVEEVGRGQVSKIMLSISGENVPRHSQTLVVDGRGWYYSVMRFSNKPLIRISGAFLKYDFDHHHFSDVFFSVSRCGCGRNSSPPWCWRCALTFTEAEALNDDVALSSLENEIQGASEKSIWNADLLLVGVEGGCVCLMDGIWEMEWRMTSKRWWFSMWIWEACWLCGSPNAEFWT